MWTKLTNIVDNCVDKPVVIHTNCSFSKPQHPLSTSNISYKTPFNTKKETYQDGMSRKIINFASC